MNDFSRGLLFIKTAANFLKKPASILAIILVLIGGITFFTCQIDNDDATTYLWQRDYSLIDIQKPIICNWFYRPFVADSGVAGKTIHIKGRMINAYGTIFIINKERSK